MFDRVSMGADTSKRSVTRTMFLPEPTPREKQFTIVSVDDHIVEPPDMFVGRLPRQFQDAAPRIVERDDGAEVWLYEDKEYPNIGFNAVVGKPKDAWSAEPARFDEMRRGCWDVHFRVKDMDLNDVYASLNFPSFLAGFAGQKFSDANDQALGLATMRAWNDWHIDTWCGSHPTRLIPCQITWLNDAELAAAEIRRNADRGFKAVSFTELPERIGRPSLHTGYWDPFVQACEETGTVICLHIGSSSSTQTSSEDAPPETIQALFPMNAQLAAVDWLYSQIPMRFPQVKIMLSEGGIGWVPGMIDRIDHNWRHHDWTGTWPRTPGTPSPVEVFRRNFWFCALDDPTAFVLRDHIGLEHIVLESDYPHVDGTWPNTQDVVRESLRDLTDEEVRKVCYENACAVFRHPLPG
jgi:predicted TIM-barrel fold metal-dependent hydrolase